MWKSNCRGASPPLLNRGLHAIDATSARQRGNFHTERDRLGVLAGLRVSEWRAAPPVDGVDIRTPSHQILDGSEVPFGSSKVQGSPVVVVCVWKSTSESGLRDPSQPSRRRVDGVRS